MNGKDNRKLKAARSLIFKKIKTAYFMNLFPHKTIQYIF